MKDPQKKKSFKVGAAMTIGGVVVGSLGCILTGPPSNNNECCVNPAPIIDMGPGLDMSDMRDMPVDSEPDIVVNPGLVDMPPDADMTNPTDMPVDSEPDFTVNPAPIDMSVDADMLSDMKNDG